MKQTLIIEIGNCADQSASSRIHAKLLVLMDFYSSVNKQLLVLMDFYSSVNK